MKTVMGLFCAVLACAVIGCQNTEDANEKITQCIEEEYGTDTSDEMLSEWKLTCEDGENACDDCVDCVMDVDCEALFDGECDKSCK